MATDQPNSAATDDPRNQELIDVATSHGKEVADDSAGQEKPLSVENLSLVQVLTPPSRLKILAVLFWRHQPLPRSTICEQAEIHRETFYEQIKVLEAWNFVTVDHVEGNVKYYRPIDGDWQDRLAELAQVFRTHDPEWRARLDDQ